MQHLRKQNFRIFIVTNQSGIARGLFTENDLKLFHIKMKKKLLIKKIKIDEIKYSPYHPKGIIKKFTKNHKSRKPGNLMIKQLFKKWPVNIKKSFMIGDRISDVEAGLNFGCKSILVLTGYGESEKSHVQKKYGSFDRKKYKSIDRVFSKINKRTSIKDVINFLSDEEKI